MKMIFAVIQPTKLDAVQQALARLDVTRMTVCDAMGYARQRGQLETYRGHEYKTNLLRKIGLEIAVNDDFVDRTVECLEEVARTSAEGHTWPNIGHAADEMPRPSASPCGSENCCPSSSERMTVATPPTERVSVLVR